MYELLLCLFAATVMADKKGTSFVVLGDFGWMGNLKDANIVFDGIEDMKKNADKDSEDDFDFFITVGDNLYTNSGNPKEPLDSEFYKMIGLFTDRPSIKDIPIYPVRGNHDCDFNDEYVEKNLSKKFDNWKMDELYYRKDIPIDKDGKKLSLLMTDSCYLLCHSTLNDPSLFETLDQETQQMLGDSMCKKGSDFHNRAMAMMDWMNTTMADAASDPDVIWKASSMHHMMYG